MKFRRGYAVGGGIAAALLVLFVLLKAFSSASGTNAATDAGGVPAPELLKDARAGTPASPPSGVDLLDLISVSKDAIAGAWGFQERALITSGVPWGRLQLPCVPPVEYDLKLVATRKRGVNALVVGVVQDGAQGIISLDGWDGRTSSLPLGDGADPSTNETTHADIKVLKWNKPTSIVVSVRKDGIAVTSEGRKILEWKGKSSDFHLPPGYLVPQPQALFIGSYDSVFRIDEIVLVPVTGDVRLLRPSTPPAPAGTPR